MKEINEVYQNMLNDLLFKGTKVGNTTELLNYSFKLENIEDNVVSIEGRHQPHYTIGELLWYLEGRNDVNFISKFGSYWDKITDDGVTNNSAYGYIIHNKFGYDQLELAIRQLKEDPNSRRAIININTPNSNKIITRDLQCTVSLHPYIRDNKVHMTAIMRSNDVITGVPFDVTYFTLLQKIIAKRLGLKTGTYTHFDVSLHLYDRNLEAAKELITAKEISVEYNLERLFDANIRARLCNAVDKHWDEIGKAGFLSLCEDLGIIRYIN